jgi:phage portal protein BeeE
MGLFDRFLKRSLKVQIIDSDAEAFNFSAQHQSAVFACVRVLSETIASLPLIFYRRLSNGGK